jgi:competence protein ComEC
LKPIRIIQLLFAALILITSVTVFEVKKTSSTNDKTVIYFFDVGQGDSELIQKGDYQILIDGGPDDKVLAELGKAMPIGDRKIEMVVLTHPHADHLAGLNQVLDRYEVDRIYGSGVISATDQYLAFLNKIKDKKIPYFVPETGETIQPYDKAKITFLWPGESYLKKTENNLNNTSEVFNFCLELRCTLFTGDLEAKGQQMMTEQLSQIGKTGLLSAEIIKVPHHGSNNALDNKTYDQIKAKTAIIEVGRDNQYGHPHKELTDFLNQNKIEIKRTDQLGTIKHAF